MLRNTAMIPQFTISQSGGGLKRKLPVSQRTPVKVVPKLRKKYTAAQIKKIQDDARKKQIRPEPAATQKLKRIRRENIAQRRKEEEELKKALESEEAQILTDADKYGIKNISQLEQKIANRMQEALAADIAAIRGDTGNIRIDTGVIGEEAKLAAKSFKRRKPITNALIEGAAQGAASKITELGINYVATAQPWNRFMNYSGNVGPQPPPQPFPPGQGGIPGYPTVAVPPPGVEQGVDVIAADAQVPAPRARRPPRPSAERIAASRARRPPRPQVETPLVVNAPGNIIQSPQTVFTPTVENRKFIPPEGLSVHDLSESQILYLDPRFLPNLKGTYDPNRLTPDQQNAWDLIMALNEPLPTAGAAAAAIPDPRRRLAFGGTPNPRVNITPPNSELAAATPARGRINVTEFGSPEEVGAAPAATPMRQNINLRKPLPFDLGTPARNPNDMTIQRKLEANARRAQDMVNKLNLEQTEVITGLKRTTDVGEYLEQASNERDVLNDYIERVQKLFPGFDPYADPVPKQASSTPIKKAPKRRRSWVPTPFKKSKSRTAGKVVKADFEDNIRLVEPTTDQSALGFTKPHHIKLLKKAMDFADAGNAEKSRQILHQVRKAMSRTANDKTYQAEKYIMRALKDQGVAF